MNIQTELLRLTIKTDGKGTLAIQIDNGMINQFLADITNSMAYKF